MIKRLRRRFVLIAAISLLIVETLIIGSINIVNVYRINNEEDQLLELIADNDGRFPEFNKPHDQKTPPDSADETDTSSMSDDNEDHKPSPDMKKKFFNEETKYQTRYFTVRYNGSDSLDKVDTGHIAAVTSDKAVEYADEVRESDNTSGYTGNYKYLVSDCDDSGKLYIFLDCRKDNETKSQFIAISLGIAAAGYVLVCAMILILSKRAVKPFIENYEKQKQFITDAGHEIKTPIAIIMANTEVIEMTSEPSEWTESIKNQIQRLNILVADLLRLSKMEENDIKLTFNEFDLSEAFDDSAAPFETLAQTKGKTLKIITEEGIRLNGDEGAVRQLISILIENAVKYSDDNGLIKAELYRTANGKNVKIRVSDTCKVPPKGDLNRLFDRFYRADMSRSRSEDDTKTGNGIGLSIAKAVCEAHKGKITCKAEKGEIVFTAVLKI